VPEEVHTLERLNQLRTRRNHDVLVGISSGMSDADRGRLYSIFTEIYENIQHIKLVIINNPSLLQVEPPSPVFLQRHPIFLSRQAIPIIMNMSSSSVGHILEQIERQVTVRIVDTANFAEYMH
jgi:hypothetical protein